MWIVLLKDATAIVKRLLRWSVSALQWCWGKWYTTKYTPTSLSLNLEAECSAIHHTASIGLLFSPLECILVPLFLRWECTCTLLSMLLKGKPDIWPGILLSFIQDLVLIFTCTLMTVLVDWFLFYDLSNLSTVYLKP